jgi:hypothetical protein
MPPQGMPPQGFQQQPAFQQQPQGYPPQQQAPQQGGPGFLAYAPKSKPGTLFGIPLATLRDQALERKALIICGLLIAGGIFIPWMTGPTVWSWKLPKFTFLIWPIIASAMYLLVGFSPTAVRQAVPQVVMKWVPFSVALISIGIIGITVEIMMAKMGGGAAAAAAAAEAAKAGIKFTPPEFSMSGPQIMLVWGYPILCFGLLARLARPEDQTARIIIAVGAGMMLVWWLDFTFEGAFTFKGQKALDVIHQLLFWLVGLIAVASAVFVLKPTTVPALAGIDAFAPAVTALLLVWLVVEVLLAVLSGLIHHKMGLGAVLLGAHVLVNVIGYFGILMLTAPEAYDSLMNAFSKHKQAVAAGQVPQGPYAQQQMPQQPQQPGYPQQQGGPIQPQMPPQSWGQQPPQGGPPPGYPPQGGGGGGWPPQGGGQGR